MSVTGDTISLYLVRGSPPQYQSSFVLVPVRPLKSPAITLPVESQSVFALPIL